MKRRSGELPEDDGRVIANMNVEGMPWYDPKRDAPQDALPKESLDKSALRQTIFSAWGAAMLVVLAFGAGISLFVWLLTVIW